LAVEKENWEFEKGGEPGFFFVSNLGGAEFNKKKNQKGKGAKFESR